MSTKSAMEVMDFINGGWHSFAQNAQVRKGEKVPPTKKRVPKIVYLWLKYIHIIHDNCKSENVGNGFYMIEGA